MSNFYDVLPGLIIFVISLILIITFYKLKSKNDENKNTYNTLLWVFSGLLFVDFLFYFIIYPIM